MNAKGPKKNGHLKVERGGRDIRGRRRSSARTSVELYVDDAMRRQYMAVVTPRGTVPSRAIQEIREGRQAPWRGNVRRAIEMRDGQVPRDICKAVMVVEMERAVDAVYDGKRAA
jgi:hypothetical protein